MHFITSSVHFCVLENIVCCVTFCDISLLLKFAQFNDMVQTGSLHEPSWVHGH